MSGILSRPKAPVLPEPEVVPQADDVEIQRARQRTAKRGRRQTGRASTFLSEGPQTLGGG